MKEAVKERSRRVVKRGLVVKLSGAKTIAVNVERVTAHPLYRKMIRRRTKLLVHDEKGTAKKGDVVEIMESRPMSHSKHWRLVKVIENASDRVMPIASEEESEEDDTGSDNPERS